MTRHLLLAVLIAAVVSTSVGFALGAASNPPQAGAAAGDSETVTQLKRLNAKVTALNKKTGNTQTAKGSVRGLLTIICDYTASIDCGP